MFECRNNHLENGHYFGACRGSLRNHSNMKGWCCTSLSGAAWPAVHTKHHLAVDMLECKNMRITRDEKRLLFKRYEARQHYKIKLSVLFKLLNVTFALLWAIYRSTFVYVGIFFFLSGINAYIAQQFHLLTYRDVGNFPRCTHTPQFITALPWYGSPLPGTTETHLGVRRGSP